ncbi:YrIlm family inverse autotransporter adhesin [Yersinia hibernica]|uniref:YrIlm family inverse autotransporter adhesin n=1 Tax=Yersinia hibernica TaxID=2339259 RepID=UPI0011A65D23|nr:YrIlm family inverse autotransporter adhesin [Yersinia hibernica]
MHNFYWTKSFKTPSGRKFAAACAQQRTFRVIAWVNILFQLLFPLSLSFTPAIAAVPISKATLVNIPTESYILTAGENVNIVAKRNGMTVDELKRINIYRTFSKPFNKLASGDEIDIPRKTSPFSIDNQKNKNADIPLENKLAGYAQTGAAALSTGNAAKSGERMARSVANNEFNSQAQQWLSQFGTARVQMNLNDDFKLDGSAVDVLLPLYDNQKSILFTQLGARNQDSRNTVNIGAGVRTFQNNWMYGANTFFDNDMTGKNRRVGIGAEAWADYLKLSANSYFGTTDWHQSRDFADYNERPANGYDVRAEAYLPTYPQLGGKLMYEKYRGDEVALFGKDNRQKNPYAVTAGVNYTPIPLLTVATEHRAGKGGKNDSSINFQLNYRLGESWQSHLSPSAVASSRTLAGSRYDLVERNNNIVLDYQKQALMQLTLPDAVTGEALSRAIVNAQVVSKYGLERVDWDSAGLIAAGGSVTQVSPQTISITLPPYQSTRSSNTHTLSAVAHDQQGNASPRATMQIVVIPSTAQITAANLTVVRDNASANGTETNEVKAIVTDAGNNPLSGHVVSFEADNGATVVTVIGTTGADGVATATVTNMTAGTTTVKATVNGVSQSVPTTFEPDDSTAQITAANLTVVRDNASANGTETNEVKAIVTDAGNNPLSGHVVSFEADNGATVVTAISTTGADGIATTTVTNMTAGTTTVKATVNGISQTKDINFSQIFNISIETTKDNAISGEESNTVKATVLGPDGNGVANVMVDFTASSDITLTPASGMTNSSGEIFSSVTKSGSTGGKTTITATISGLAANDSLLVNFLTLRQVSSVIAPGSYVFTFNKGFPTTGYSNAKFQINASGNITSNTNYDWTSNETISMNVDNEGNVTLIDSNVRNKLVKITARDNINAYRYEFKVTSWFISGSYRKFSDAENYCSTNGMVIPSRDQLTQGTNIRGIGSLWSEWQKPTSWASGDANTAYWSNTQPSTMPGYRYMVNIVTGDGTVPKVSDGANLEYVPCVQN